MYDHKMAELVPLNPNVSSKCLVNKVLCVEKYTFDVNNCFNLKKKFDRLRDFRPLLTSFSGVLSICIAKGR